MSEKLTMYRTLGLNLSLLALTLAIYIFLIRVALPALNSWMKKHYVLKGLNADMLRMCVCGCEYYKHDDDGECAYCDHCRNFRKVELEKQL